MTIIAASTSHREGGHQIGFIIGIDIVGRLEFWVAFRGCQAAVDVARRANHFDGFLDFWVFPGPGFPVGPFGWGRSSGTFLVSFCATCVGKIIYLRRSFISG